MGKGACARGLAPWPQRGPISCCFPHHPGLPFSTTSCPGPCLASPAPSLFCSGDCGLPLTVQKGPDGGLGPGRLGLVWASLFLGAEQGSICPCPRLVSHVSVSKAGKPLWPFWILRKPRTRLALGPSFSSTWRILRFCSEGCIDSASAPVLFSHLLGQEIPYHGLSPF